MFTSLCGFLSIYLSIANPSGVIFNVPDRVFEGSWFELQTCYYIYFQTNTHKNGMSLLILLARGYITAVLLQEWLWH